MRFQPVRYLEWAQQRFDLAPPRYNLASSGLPPASARQAGIDLASLRLSGVNAGGHPRVRELLAKRAGVDESRVALVPGGTTLANFLVLSALVAEGDTVLCEWPAYEPLWRAAEAVGARIEWVQRDPFSPDTIDLAAVEQGFSRGARLLVISDLHNPSGVLMPAEVKRRLAQLAERHDAHVLVDEVYLSGVFDRPVESATSMGDRMITTSSLTKTYGLGALRAGWAIATPAIVRRMQQTLTLLNGPGVFLADEATAQALEKLDGLESFSRQRRETNWPLVQAFAKEQGLRLAASAGGFIAWARLPEGIDVDRFVERLSERHQTLVVPGTFFGAPDHIRIGFGSATELVQEGLRRLGLALQEERG